jgi:hypothetical protein
MYPTHGEPFDYNDELFREKKKEEKLERRREEDGLDMTFCGINSLVPNDNGSITGFGDREGKPVLAVSTISMGTYRNLEGELVLKDEKPIEYQTPEEVFGALQVKFAELQVISGQEGKRQRDAFLDELKEQIGRYPLD